MIDRCQYLERVAICVEAGVPIAKAEEIAARLFFASCNLPTIEDLADAERLGWSKIKMFRTMNQEGLKEWMLLKIKSKK